MTESIVPHAIVACCLVVPELVAIVQHHNNNGLKKEEEEEEVPAEHGVRKVVRTPISVMNHEKSSGAVEVVVPVHRIHPRPGVDRRKITIGAIVREHV